MTGDDVAAALGQILAEAIAGGDAGERAQIGVPRAGGMRIELSGVSLSVASITLDFDLHDRVTGGR